MKKIIVSYTQRGTNFRFKNAVYFNKVEEFFELLNKYSVERDYTFYVHIWGISTKRELKTLEAIAKQRGYHSYQDFQESELINVLINKGARKDNI